MTYRPSTTCHILSVAITFTSHNTLVLLINRINLLYLVSLELILYHLNCVMSYNYNYVLFLLKNYRNIFPK